MSATQLKKVSTWHKSIVDWELEYPQLSLGQCALHFGVTETWLSIIRNSDVFKEYSALRRADHNDNVSLTVIEKVEEVAKISFEVLKERIEKERATIGLSIVNDVAKNAIKALGFGASPSRGGDQSQVNVFLGGGVDAALLDRARNTMRSVANAHTPPERVGATASEESVLIEGEVEDGGLPKTPQPLPSAT